MTGIQDLGNWIGQALFQCRPGDFLIGSLPRLRRHGSWVGGDVGGAGWEIELSLSHCHGWTK